MLPDEVKTSISLRKAWWPQPTFAVETAISAYVDEVVQLLILHQTDYFYVYVNLTIVLLFGTCLRIVLDTQEAEGTRFLCYRSVSLEYSELYRQAQWTKGLKRVDSSHNSRNRSLR